MFTVSVGALIKRVNRKLREAGEMLRRTRPFYDHGRGPYYDNNTGEFYIIDVDRNCIASTHVDLEAYGRELGVLSNFEKVSEE